MPVIVPDSVYRIKDRYHRYIFSKEWWWRKSKEKKAGRTKKVVNPYCEKSDQSVDDDDDKSIE